LLRKFPSAPNTLAIKFVNARKKTPFANFGTVMDAVNPSKKRKSKLKNRMKCTKFHQKQTMKKVINLLKVHEKKITNGLPLLKLTLKLNPCTGQKNSNSQVSIKSLDSICQISHPL
jgi:ureidoglycolate hydrolase